jgi:hypothetical protein
MDTKYPLEVDTCYPPWESGTKNHIAHASNGHKTETLVTWEFVCSAVIFARFDLPILSKPLESG